MQFLFDIVLCLTLFLDKKLKHTTNKKKIKK